MLETSGRSIFEAMMNDSTSKAITSWGGETEKLEFLFFASDSTQHFINALPNPAVKMVGELLLRPNVKQHHLSLMGCCGGLQALALCFTAVKSKPGSYGMVVLFEATGTQNAVRQPVLDDNDLIQLGLFGDGSSAVVVKSGDLTPQEQNLNKLKLIDHNSVIVPDTTDLLSHANHWDHVYSVVDVDVPEKIRSHVPRFLGDLLNDNGIDEEKKKNTAFLCHPGGPRILQTLQEELGLDDAQLCFSWQVLAKHGNMSGATNLAVIDAFFQSNFHDFKYALAVAFGPGICVQAHLFKVERSACAGVLS